MASRSASQILVMHALYVATRGLGSEWNGGIENGIDLGLASPLQVLLESRWYFEREAQFTISQTPVELVVARTRGPSRQNSRSRERLSA